jgi:hypothetical protein
MKFLILFILILTAFNAFASEKDCKDGKCLPRLLRKVRIISEIYRAECIPKNMKVSDIENYHKEHPLTEQCWRYISEINYLDDEITKQQALLDAQSSCENGDCKNPVVKPFFANIEDLLKAVPANTCTEKKKERVWKKCGEDLKCIFVAGALGISGYSFEKLIPKDYQPKRCNLGDDSCSSKFAGAFLSSAMHFFSGVWDLTKMIGEGIANGSKKFWHWATRAEDHSSTSQLALAKASEDPGIFKQLITDFPGTMMKIFSAFYDYIVTWFKEDVFCKKWSGKPHVGKCIRPLDDIECVGCKTLITGSLCSLPGTVIAEIVPAFISGGITAAIKHGATAGSKLARVIKTSNVARTIVKSSKTIATGASITSKSYRLSKLRAITQSSIKALKHLSATSKTYIASTKAGKAMVFSKKALKSTTEIALLPVDNAMTGFAYKAGARSFDKALMLGKASNIGEQPLNVSRGLLKLLSPSMRSAHETEKVREKDKEKVETKKALKQ